MTIFGVGTDWASAKKKIGESDFLRQVRRGTEKSPAV